MGFSGGNTTWRQQCDQLCLMSAKLDISKVGLGLALAHGSKHIGSAWPSASNQFEWSSWVG